MIGPPVNLSWTFGWFCCGWTGGCFCCCGWTDGWTFGCLGWSSGWIFGSLGSPVMFGDSSSGTSGIFGMFASPIWGEPGNILSAIFKSPMKPFNAELIASIKFLTGWTTIPSINCITVLKKPTIPSIKPWIGLRSIIGFLNTVQRKLTAVPNRVINIKFLIVSKILVKGFAIFSTRPRPFFSSFFSRSFSLPLFPPFSDSFLDNSEPFLSAADCFWRTESISSVNPRISLTIPSKVPLKKFSTSFSLSEVSSFFSSCGSSSGGLYFCIAPPEPGRSLAASVIGFCSCEPSSFLRPKKESAFTAFLGAVNLDPFKSLILFLSLAIFAKSSSDNFSFPSKAPLTILSLRRVIYSSCSKSKLSSNPRILATSGSTSSICFFVGSSTAIYCFCCCFCFSSSRCCSKSIT